MSLPLPDVAHHGWLEGVPKALSIERAILVGHGPLPTTGRLINALEQSAAGSGTALIALDGAARTLLQRGNVPDYIIGDFDSLGDPSTLAYPEGREPPQLIAVKDEGISDLEKGLALAHHLGAKNVMIAATWSLDRPDHSIAAVLLLRAVDDWFERLAIVGEEWSIHWIGTGRSRRFESFPGQRISLLPAGPLGSVVTVQGVRWPLQEAPLSTGTQGISNRSLGDEVHIEVHSGGVVLVSFDPQWKPSNDGHVVVTDDRA